MDGLRAVAIISVVSYHVGLPGFGGGFIGVDVFFVISGFLITSLLLSEMRQHRSIDLLAFFARRARRLLPAFFLVLATTLVLGFFFLSPVDKEQEDLAKSAIAAALYFSNVHFAQHGDGYFDAPPELYPLLHTWSLSVEEQFYLLWPLALLAAAWVGRHFQLNTTSLVLGTLVVVLISSLSYSWWAAENGGDVARRAFFLLPSRAWELGIGAFVALALPYLPRSGSLFGAVFAPAGLLCIAAAVVMFHDGIAFPGIAAAIPAGGTAAVIAGGWITPRSLPIRLLASRPLVMTGLLSYSWYLWHWPLLAIGRAHGLGIRNSWRDLAIAAAAFVLASLTYRFLEHPIRTRRVARDWSNRGILGLAAIASLLAVGTAQLLRANPDQLQQAREIALAQATLDSGWSRKRCHQTEMPFVGLIARSSCMGATEANQKILIIWGDSHADHLTGMIEAAATGGQFALLPRSLRRCPPLLGVVPSDSNLAQAGCAHFNQEVLREAEQLLRENRLAGIVLSARWSIYLNRWLLSSQQGVGLGSSLRPVRDSSTAADALSYGLRSMLSRLAEKGMKALVIAPMPEQIARVPVCLARYGLIRCSVAREVAENNRTPALQALQKAVGQSSNAYLWDPLPSLCNATNCLPERDGKILYRDSNHLTYTGSRWLGQYLASSEAWTAFIGATSLGW